MPGPDPMVRIKNVQTISHLEFNVNLTNGEPALFEVYAGWVYVNSGPGDGKLHHFDFTTFVPMLPSTVRGYTSGTLIDSTVVASPAAFSTNDSDHLFAVDKAHVGLEKQDFGASCLILRAVLGMHNSFFLSFNYQVTALFSQRDPFTSINLDPETAPK